MNISKNLHLKVALACFAVTLLAHAEVTPNSLLQTKSPNITTIISHNVDPTAGSLFQFFRETGDKALDAYCKESTEFLAPLTALIPHLSDEELKKRFGTTSREEAQKIAVNFHLTRGPSISEVLPEAYRKPLVKHVKETSGEENAEILETIFARIHSTSLGNERAYETFFTPALLGAEKMMIDAEKAGMPKFNLPVLDSVTIPLQGPTPDDAKLAILKACLTKNAISLISINNGPSDLAKNLEPIKTGKVTLPTAFTKNSDLFDLFTSSGVGYNLFYGAEQATLTHMLIPDDAALEECNTHKETLLNLAGDINTISHNTLEPALKRNPSVYCTQEAKPELVNLAEKSGLFLSVDKQPTEDGCFIFLNKKKYRDYTVNPFSKTDYEKADSGNLLLIEAHHHESNPNAPHDLFATFHASSRTAQDKLDILDALVKKAKEIYAKTGRGVLLRAQGDANTDAKTLTSYLEHSSKLGLIETCKKLGQKLLATVVKMRVFTVQPKIFIADRNAKDIAFYIAIGLNEADVTQLISDETGYKQPYDDKANLPSADNPSDHYPKIINYVDKFN